MPAVQTSYSENIGQALVGQVANPQTCDIDTYIASQNINFGVAVQRTTDGGVGDEYSRCSVGATVASTNVTSFLGIAVKDPTRDASEVDRSGSEPVDRYKADAHVAVLWRGDVWVDVAGATVAKGDKLTVTASTGVLGAEGSGTGTTVGNFDGGGIVALSDKNSNNLVLVRLYGNEQRI